MVATLLGLKFRLTLAELKRSTARLVLWIILGAYALFAVALALIGLAALALVVPGNEQIAGSMTVLSGSVLVLGWTLLPLAFFGSDQTLDPSRFSPFPLSGIRLAPGLLLASILGLPGAFTAILCLGSALPWTHTPLVALVGLIGGALGFFMTQVGCRTASTALSSKLSSRKGRDLTAVISLIVVLALTTLGYAASLLVTYVTDRVDRLDDLVSAISTVANIASWTPLGAPWALVGDAGQGEWLMFLAHLALTVVYLGLGVWMYAAILDKALVAPAHSESTGAVSKDDAIAKMAAQPWARGAMAPVAAIMARCLRYWRRDPRYLGTIPSLLIMPILFTIMDFSLNSIADGGIPSGWMSVFGIAMMAVMGGFGLSADIAMDATAWWTHFATGIKGWQDRLGRVLGISVWATPMIVVAGIVIMVIIGAPARIPAALGALASLYLCALGVASIFSPLIVYPIALPGESPLRMKTGMMGSQMLSQFGCMTASGVLALPVCIWAIFAHGWTGWLVLAVGVVWGLICCAAGIIAGGKVMDSRGVAILATLIKNDSRERG
ncbi:MAG: hypothetical protein LBN10_00805 [Propionibacteriaceae bacterium]|jgi:ABC-2 type transport system permease protein|nr:hypothetical protein [Propionibacteriaceae bacterium]